MTVRYDEVAVGVIAHDAAEHMEIFGDSVFAASDGPSMNEICGVVNNVIAKFIRLAYDRARMKFDDDALSDKNTGIGEVLDSETIERDVVRFPDGNSSVK